MGNKTEKGNKHTYRKPLRTFEKKGEVNRETSYFVPLENVVNSDKHDIKTMIDGGRYFSIFAPRQSGKTTYFKYMCDQLHQDPTYVTIILDFQNYGDLTGPRFYSRIERKFYPQLINRLKEVKCQKAEVVEQFLKRHRLTDHLAFGELLEELNRIMEFKKIVIFIDEFDGIPVDELSNFLTTLRALYNEYKTIEPKALYSVGLVGIRNITKLIVGGVSPFNIADQVDLPSFTAENIAQLYGQYTRETNQPFTPTAVRRVFEETNGQPWLVNRLGTILTVDVKPETVDPIDEHDVEKAIQILLKERNDHFDNLSVKAKLYKETFVEIVFGSVEYDPEDEDQSWLEQYGLIRRENDHAVASNPIYRARYLKAFFKETQSLAAPAHYVLPGDVLDMKRILKDFEAYIAQIGVNAFYKGKKPYERTGQFLLTARLYQFVTEGDGELRHELPSGFGRMDILLNYKGRKYIIETKINRHNLSRTLEDGLTQVSEKYMASEFAQEAYLVIFDLKRPVGHIEVPQHYPVGDKSVTTHIIGISRPD